MHIVEYPLDAFNYYPPALSRYAEVEAGGKLNRHGSDSKVACTQLRVGAEIGLSGLISAAIKFTFNRVDWTNVKESATGYQGAASATGTRGAASATGDQGAASATGYQGAASATGYQGAASATGQESVACALGVEGKVKGALGGWLVLAEWKRDDNYDWHRIDVQSRLVDGNEIKPDIWYQLKDGQFVECE